MEELDWTHTGVEKFQEMKMSVPRVKASRVDGGTFSNIFHVLSSCQSGQGPVLVSQAGQLTQQPP